MLLLLMFGYDLFYGYNSSQITSHFMCNFHKTEVIFALINYGYIKFVDIEKLLTNACLDCK